MPLPKGRRQCSIAPLVVRRGWIRPWTGAAILVVLFMACLSGGAARASEPGDIQRAWGAGRWFPSEEASLRAMVEGLIGQARVPEIQGHLVAALSPHAGYAYSGKVAGHTFRALRDQARAGRRPECVVVLGFSHRGAFPGTALLEGQGIRTPLGVADLDRQTGAFLVGRDPGIVWDSRPHKGEHSAENLIPFVQAALPGVPLVVGLLGEAPAAPSLAQTLQALARTRRILVLASTDLLHDPDYDRVVATDRKTLDFLRRLDVKGLRAAWHPQRQILCGIAPVTCALTYASLEGCREGTVLLYRNSGDDHPEGRGTWVVGYASVLYAAPP